jgi:hypothetical protein
MRDSKPVRYKSPTKYTLCEKYSFNQIMNPLSLELISVLSLANVLKSSNCPIEIMPKSCLSSYLNELTGEEREQMGSWYLVDETVKKAKNEEILLFKRVLLDLPADQKLRCIIEQRSAYQYYLKYCFLKEFNQYYDLSAFRNWL